MPKNNYPRIQEVWLFKLDVYCCPSSLKQVSASTNTWLQNRVPQSVVKKAWKGLSVLSECMNLSYNLQGKTFGRSSVPKEPGDAFCCRAPWWAVLSCGPWTCMEGCIACPPLEGVGNALRTKCWSWNELRLWNSVAGALGVTITFTSTLTQVMWQYVTKKKHMKIRWLFGLNILSVPI